MCNCGSPNSENYVAYNDAVAGCNSYPSGSPGFGSCVAHALGFVNKYYYSFLDSAFRYGFLTARSDLSEISLVLVTCTVFFHYFCLYFK